MRSYTARAPPSFTHASFFAQLAQNCIWRRSLVAADELRDICRALLQHIESTHGTTCAKRIAVLGNARLSSASCLFVTSLFAPYVVYKGGYIIYHGAAHVPPGSRLLYINLHIARCTYRLSLLTNTAALAASKPSSVLHDAPGFTVSYYYIAIRFYETISPVNIGCMGNAI